jgi:membrane associated rhomboid family serine protease
MGANLIDDLRYGAMLLYPGDPLVDPMRVLREEPWRLLSSCFVHFGFVHFAMNMAALVQLARLAEPAISAARFTIAYVVTGTLGFGFSLSYALVFPQQMLTAGASGAIFGVMGVILGFLVRRRDPRWKVWARNAVFYSLLFGFVIRANNAAHIGGLLVGAVFGALFAPGAPKPASRLQVVLAGLCLAACVASLVLAQQSELWRAAEVAMQRSG